MPIGCIPVLQMYDLNIAEAFMTSALNCMHDLVAITLV